TSHLIVPDGVAPVVPAPNTRLPAVGFGGGGAGGPAALAPKQSGGRGVAGGDFGRGGHTAPSGPAENRYYLQAPRYDAAKKDPGKSDTRTKEAGDKLETYREAERLLRRHENSATQSGKLGVDLSLQTDGLRNQSRLELTALRQVQGRNVMEVGGVWIDEG